MPSAFRSMGLEELKARLVFEKRMAERIAERQADFVRKIERRIETISQTPSSVGEQENER